MSHCEILGRERAHSRLGIVASLLLVIAGLSSAVLAASSAALSKKAEKIIIDTDIGTDIDDAFAVALALRSPEFDILGLATASGDTDARAKILDRMEITLVAIGPLSNLGGVIDQSPETFRKVKRVVTMGGWIAPLKPDYGNGTSQEPTPEYNILVDIGAAQKLFLSGVLLYVMPIDSTAHLALDEVKWRLIFAQGTPLTESLTLQYHQWNEGVVTPVLFDAMTLAYILDPSLCPVRPVHIRVDDKGLTRVESGTPNAQVCLHSDADAFFRFYMSRLLAK
jgi:purine nucleosidase